LTRRETLLNAAFAIWGLAIAIGMVTVWDQPATPDQLPGFAKSRGFDGSGPFRWVAGLMLLPVLLPILLRPVTRVLERRRPAGWPGAVPAPSGDGGETPPDQPAGTPALHWVIFVSTLVTLWLVTVHRTVWWTIVPCAIVVLACTLLRNRDLRFTRRDVVLIAAFLPTLLAIRDIDIGLHGDGEIYVAALLLLFLRITITFIPSPLPPALAFVAAPLGLVLQTGFFARDQRYFGWHALAVVVITPFVLRLFLRNAKRAAQVLVFVVYPLTLYAYANALSIGTAEGKPRIDFFEDGHSLLPASEYLRGELPYRDMLPAHGLIEDGLFDLVAMQIGDVSLGSRAKARAVVGSLVTVALYAVAFAATGSAEGAFFAVLLSLMTGMFRGSIRFLPAMVTLALIITAVRRRKWRFFAYAGAGVVIAGLTSLDFAAYAFLALVVAALRAGRPAIRNAIAGIAAAAVPLFVVLAIFGILDDFLRGTFVETLSVGPAYTLNFFTPPEAMARNGAFPDAIAALLDRDTFPYLFWCAAAVFVAITIARRASRRIEPFVILGVFIVATAISYAERHHIYFGMIATVLVIALILHLLRRRHYAMATLAIVGAIALAGPTSHMGVIGWMRRARGPVEQNWAELKTVPRARGALLEEKDRRAIESVRTYLARLQPDETFFDFTNSGMLYFLFDRDHPNREYEVAFYETEEKQREVIRRIESNPKVRAALVPATPHGRFSVDGIPNAERAPLVWAYLQANFHPEFEDGDVVFWRRN
jgi:hypothetical protein